MGYNMGSPMQLPSLPAPGGTTEKILRGDFQGAGEDTEKAARSMGGKAAGAFKDLLHTGKNNFQAVDPATGMPAQNYNDRLADALRGSTIMDFGHGSIAQDNLSGGLAAKGAMAMGQQASLADVLSGRAGQAYGQQQQLNDALQGQTDVLSGRAGQAYGQQQQLMNALQGQAMGQGGPGSALANQMLQEGTNRNIQQAAGMLASQKGINPAMAARMNAQNAAAANQQAAGQATNFALQNQMAAQNQLGGMLGQSYAQNLGGAQNLQGLTSGNLNQAYAQNVGGAQNLLGNISGTAIPNAAGMINTGREQDIHQALGKGQLNEGIYNSTLGAATQQRGQDINSNLETQKINAGITAQNQAQENNMLGSVLNVGGALLGKGSMPGSGGGAAGGSAGSGGLAGAGEGGASAAAMASHGGRIGGHPQVPGDSEKNDTVPAMLSPGEIVIPRTAAHSRAAAIKFLDALRKWDPKEKERQGAQKFSDGEVDVEKAPYMPGPTPPVAEAPETGANAPEVSSPSESPTAGGPPSPDWSGSSGVAPSTKSNPNANFTMETGNADRAAARGAENPYDALAKESQENQKAETSAVNSSAQAVTNAANEQQKILSDHANALQAMQQKSARNLQDIENDNATLEKQINETKIDPNRLWNDASTGNKVLAGIGLLLSGIGSGLTGQRNMAMDVIEKSIDRDIEAQKAELGKKENLLSMNLRKYGNIQAATQATAIQMSTVAQAQIAATAARSQSQQAQSNAQMAIAQLRQENTNRKIALAQAQLGPNLVAGNMKVYNPEQLPREMQERAVKMPDGSYMPVASKDVKKEVDEVSSAAQDFQNTINEMRDVYNKTGAFGSWGKSELNTKAKALSAKALAQINHLQDTKRLSEVDIKEALHPQVPDASSFFSTESKTKLDTLQNTLDSKVNAVYGQAVPGYKPSAFGSYGFKDTTGKTKTQSASN